MFRKDLTKPDGRQLHLYSRKPISSQIIATNPPHSNFIPNPQMRWHPLREEWVVYAAHRQDRTFLPPREYSPLAVTKSDKFPTELPAGEYDVAVFENLFPSLSIFATGETLTSPANLDSNLASGVSASRAGTGICEVVVFTQNPDISLGKLSVEEIKLVLQVIGDRTKELGARPEIQYVLPFENRGVEVGVTLHHPHGQIYSYPFVPPVAEKIWLSQKKYFEKNGRTLIEKILKEELVDERRVLVNEKNAVAFIPSFARYAYETWIVPKRSEAWLYDLSDAELFDMAQVLKTLLTKFDKMWDKPFPYLMAFYQAPTDGESHPEFHTHLQIYPAYRSKDKLKYLAGTEIAGGIFVNDSYPEDKARDINGVSL